jgi:hypothetical protein
MRKIIVCNIVSLDGYYDDPEGRPPVAGMDAIFDAYRVVQRDPLTFVNMGFARLREVSATYTLPDQWVATVGARRRPVLEWRHGTVSRPGAPPRPGTAW